MENLIYLDNNSTTKIDPVVLDAMIPFLKDLYANAASSHTFGLKIKKAVDLSRSQIADLIKGESKRIVFTSGATEAINLALKSITHNSRGKNHIVTLQTEHRATLDTCKYLENLGVEVTYLPVKMDGLVELKALRDAIRPDTFLVSIMWVNNETGVIQDISSISQICHDTGVLFMTDATQAVGKIPVDVSEHKIDFCVLSGHKFYAPKGVGALYYSENAEKYLNPLIHGGGHEKGLRSGTINTAAIVGLGKAAEMASLELGNNLLHIKTLRDRLENELLKIEGSFINGNYESRIFNVSNLCFPNLESEVLIGRLKNIAFSNGSACSSSVIEPSHVLTSMHLSLAKANSSIRLSLGKFNTKEEIEYAASELKASIKSLQLII